MTPTSPPGAFEVTSIPYRDLFRAHPAPMWVGCRETGQILDVNDAALALHGRTRDEFLALPAGGLDEVADAKPGQPGDRRRYRRRDGRVVEVELQSGTVDLAAGGVELFVAKPLPRDDHGDASQAAAPDEWFRRLFRTMPLPMWTADPNGTVDYCSRTLHEFVRGPSAQFRPRDLVRALHPRDRRSCLLEWRRCIADGRPFTASVRVRAHADGSYRWHLASARAIRDGRGAIIKWFGSAADVHERTEAEAALRASEQKLRAIFDTGPECVKIVSRDGRLLEMNPAGLRLIEAVEISAVRGHMVEQLVHPDDRATYRQIHEDASAGQPAHGQFRIIGLLGSERWLETHAVPMRLDDGAVGSVLSVSRDVTPRRRAEQALDEARRETDLILRSIADGVHVLDADARIQLQNPAAGAMLGREEQEIRGRWFHSVVDPATEADDAPDQPSPILHTLRDGQSRRIDRAQFARRDGTPFPVEYTCAPLRDELRSIRGAVVCFRDVSERRRSERMQAARTAILERIAAGASLDAMLRTITTAIEDECPGTLASIVALDAEGRHVRHLASPSLPDEYVRATDGTGIDDGDCVGAIAIRSGRPLVLPDIATAELPSGCRDLARRCGLLACSAAPVRDADGAVIASFALYRRTVADRSSADLDTIAGFANLVSIAIERIRAMESRQESEERFRQLAENIQEVFWMSDPHTTRILYISPAYETIWGRPAAGLLADPMQWFDAIVDADRPAVQRALMLKAPGQYSAEYRIQRPDGTVRWIADRSFPVRDDAGTIYRIVGTARDVTDRKRAEDALRDSERRFQAIAGATADIVWDWDLSGDHIWWSDDFEPRFGQSPASVATGRDWIACIHPEDRDRVQGEIGETIRAGQRSWRSEFRFCAPSGAVFEIEGRGCLILDGDGRPVRFVGGMSDISERKRAQMELRERVKEQRCLYRVLELTSNQSRPVEDVCLDIACCMPASLVHEDLAVASVELDGVCHRSPGWRPPTSVLRVPIIRDGREAGFVEVGYACPTRSGLDGFLPEEHALMDAVAAHIGRMLDGRLLARRLMQTERLSAVGELTGGIAHDFNNLLTVIVGNLDLLVEELEDRPMPARLAEVARTAAERGADLTHRLLAFARRQALAPRPTRIDLLVAGMADLLRRTLGELVDMTIVHPGNLWQAVVDPAQLEGAVLNLCINARDAMPDGGRLAIRLENIAIDGTYPGWNEDVVPGDYVVVSVSDSGVGMSPEVLARAFEPFYTTKGPGRGSGLGLSMVYGFVRQSRGQVKIYSEPGRGTTVRLYLPRAGTDAGPSPAPAAPVELPVGTERILMVEDDELVRDHAVGQLRSLGYTVQSARTGPEALAILRSADAFDLLFTDMVMPGGLTGRQLADEARLLRPGLPVLFTSGYTDDAIVHDGHLDPGVHFLNKPYRRIQLANKVREALGEGTRTQPPKRDPGRP